MRLPIPLHGAALGIALLLGTGCARPSDALPGDEPEQPRATGSSGPGDALAKLRQASQAEPQGATRRLLVLRLGADRPEVLESRELPAEAKRAARPRPAGWDGRFEVLDRVGRRLASGAFRIPTRVHALFGRVEGPDGPGSAPLGRPLVMLRVETPPGAARLMLWDAARHRGLGEVPL